jgi:uncharacterized protein (DUF4213/DUF364 family)
MILTETFRAIRNRRNLAGLFIEDIFLGPFFNAVQLSDGAVGAAANYSLLPPGQRWERAAAPFFRRIKGGDPLLEELLCDPASADNLVRSLRTCIISALSAPLLASGVYENFQRLSSREFASGIRQPSAMVVGWGGLMSTFLDSPPVERVHVCDLVYANPAERQRIDQEARKLRARFPHKTLTVSDGSDFGARVKDCEICAITGSTLCNGTLEKLLEECEHCDLTILQGQSGSIYPEYLFREQLIDVLLTSVKPVQFHSLARSDPGLFRTALEGGLPALMLGRLPEGRPAAVPVPRDTTAPAPRLSIVAEALRQVREFHGPRWNDLNLADIHTRGYYTCVRLTNGNQGIATNLTCVHGVHSQVYDHEAYDESLRQAAQTDRLLLHTILEQRELREREKSVQIALLNALSGDFLTSGGWALRGLRFQRVIQLYSFIENGDTVAMIGCMGNHSCDMVGQIGSIKRIFFSDLEYTDPFRGDVESFVAKHFRKPEIVTLSDGSDNRSICEKADVVFVTSDTLCTDTLDDILEWAKGARRVFVMGWSFAMDPKILLRRGVCAMTVMLPVHPDIPRKAKELDLEGLEQLFVRGYLLT